MHTCAFKVHKNHMTFVNANLSMLTIVYITNTSKQQIMVGILALSIVRSWPQKWKHEHVYDMHNAM